MKRYPAYDPPEYVDWEPDARLLDSFRAVLSEVPARASIVDDLVYIADYTGRVFCLDAKTGKKYWEHDTKGHIWGSTFVADGKVYIGNEEGELTIIKAGKEYNKDEVKIIEFPAPIYSTPVASNGTLYIGTQTHLYAFSEEKK